MSPRPVPGMKEFQIQGVVQVENRQEMPADMRLAAYAFRPGGKLLGQAELDPEGRFTIPLKLAAPLDVELFVGPAGEADEVYDSSAYSQTFSEREWQGEGNRFFLRPEIRLPKHIWYPWWPLRVCVHGRIQKITYAADGSSTQCPVPFVKVEVFDVDRWPCWWPYIRRWWDFLRLKPIPVIRIPELIEQVPPIPGPGPVERKFRNPLALVALNPQPEPPRPWELSALNPQPEPPFKPPRYSAVSPQLRPSVSSAASALSSQAEPPLKWPNADSLNPQPEPPFKPPRYRARTELLPTDSVALGADVQRVGEMKALDAEAASKLENLTLTSRIPPWVIFPKCFYSKKLIGHTHTDCDGNFRYCFRWYPWHRRYGRLRYDRLPDIIIKVTQVINGVETVIYMDPYTSTRWNQTDCEINLTLDDPQIVCGPGCDGEEKAGEGQATIYQIGPDNLWLIDTHTGLYKADGDSNGAYGSSLWIRGDFGPDLKLGYDPVTGDPRAYYYKLSYAKTADMSDMPADAAFHAIQTPLSMLRAPIGGEFETYLIGPQPAGSPIAGLYEVQDTQHWWMLYPGAPLTTPGGMVLALWETGAFEPDQGDYILRMEMFDHAGVKMSTTFADYSGDGTGAEPAGPPTQMGTLNLHVHIDNALMTFSLTTPAINDCGVVPWSDTLTLDFTVNVSQPNGRVHRWDLYYTRGTDATERPGVPPQPGWSKTYPNGSAPPSEVVHGNDMLLDSSTSSGKLESTCAFALVLRAWAHVRVNYGWWDYWQKVYAIAIEHCPPCEKC